MPTTKANKAEEKAVLAMRTEIVNLIEGRGYTLIGFTDVDNFYVETADGKRVRFEPEHVRLLRLLRMASTAWEEVNTEMQRLRDRYQPESHPADGC
jgi:hypothetical protein